MKDLTQGSVLSHALTMAVPIFAGLVLVLLCGLIDLYFVAGLGEAAIAGIGAAGNAGFITNALTQIVSVGTLAAVSQAVGRRDRTDANLKFNQSLGLSVVCGACTMAAGFAAARPYMNSVAADAATVAAGTTYLVWFMPALGLQFMMFAMSSALRGIGIVAPMMYVQALTVTINIMLAPVLILGWGTGHALGVKERASPAPSLSLAAFSLFGCISKKRKTISRSIPTNGVRSCAVGAHLERRPSGWRRVRHHVRVHGNDILCPRRFWSIRASRLQHRFSRARDSFRYPRWPLPSRQLPIIGQNFGAGNGGRVKQAIRHVLIAVTTVMLVATVVTQSASRASSEGLYRRRNHDCRRRLYS